MHYPGFCFHLLGAHKCAYGLDAVTMNFRGGCSVQGELLSEGYLPLQLLINALFFRIGDKEHGTGACVATHSCIHGKEIADADYLLKLGYLPVKLVGDWQFHPGEAEDFWDTTWVPDSDLALSMFPISLEGETFQIATLLTLIVIAVIRMWRDWMVCWRNPAACRDIQLFMFLDTWRAGIAERSLIDTIGMLDAVWCMMDALP